jgi:uncharacterized protein (TIGR02246 family)
MLKAVRMLVCTVVTILPAVSWAGPAEEAGAIIDRWAAAYSSNDRDAILKLYAPDAVLMGTSDATILQGPEQIAGYFARLPGSGNKTTVGQRKTMAIGNDMALGVGWYDFSIVREGKATPSPARFSFVIAKRGNDWLIVHHHSSRRPPPRQ